MWIKFRCLDTAGYEDRLTEGKVYNGSPSEGALGDEDCLLVMECDDGTPVQVFEERFERSEVSIEEAIETGERAELKVKHMEQLRRMMENGTVSLEEARRVMGDPWWGMSK